MSIPPVQIKHKRQWASVPRLLPTNPRLARVRLCSATNGLATKARITSIITISNILTFPDVRVVEAPQPAITEPKDVIVKVTGTTVCGSDLHLYHKEIMQLQQGDILGHEYMGIVDEVGSEVKTVKKGDRVVSSFQIMDVKTPQAYKSEF